MAVKDNANISIDIKLADKALLEDINNNLKSLLKALEGREKWESVQAPREADAVGTNEPKAEAEAEAPAEAEGVKEEKKTEPTVTTTQLQKMAIELSAQGRKVEVRDIVKAYAEKISELPEDKLEEVMSRLEELKNGK